MNWRRVFIFVAILLLGANLAALPFGYIQGLYATEGKPTLTWIPLATTISVQLASLVVFLILAIKQNNKPWLHGFAVAVFAWLISFPITVLVFNFPFITWVFSGIFVIITYSLGTLIGNFIRNKVQRT